MRSAIAGFSSHNANFVFLPKRNFFVSVSNDPNFCKYLLKNCSGIAFELCHQLEECFLDAGLRTDLVAKFHGS
jgi:hypothetical protein